MTNRPGLDIIIPVARRDAEQTSPKHAAVAHLVERHLAKVEVASSSLVGRSKESPRQKRRFLPGACCFCLYHAIMIA